MVTHSIRHSIRHSVRHSIRHSVKQSVTNSIRDSVRHSITNEGNQILPLVLVMSRGLNPKFCRIYDNPPPEELGPGWTLH